MRQIAFWLSLLLIFAIPWENSAKFDGIGSLAKLLGVATAGIWVAMVARSGELRRLRPFHIGALLFVLWNGLSVLWSVDIGGTFLRTITYAQTLVLVILLWDLYRTPEALRAGLQAFVLGAFVCVGLLGHAYFFEGGADARRLTVMGFNPNVAAFGLVLALPMAWYLARLDVVSRSARLWRWLNLAYLPLAMLAMVQTGARSAMASAVVAFGFMILSLGQLRPVARVTFLVAVLASPALALPFVSWEKLQRIASTSDEVSDGTFGGRHATWAEGMQLMAAHPWLGIGSGGFTVAAVETRKAPHNFVVALLVEVGIVGFVLFAGVMLWTGLDALKQDRWLRRLWLTLLVMWVLNAAVHNYEDKKHTWVLFSLVAVGAGLVQREPEAVGAELR
ncbi:MAG: O-antigen ligase family protein [Myxococcota bacterium]